MKTESKAYKPSKGEVNHWVKCTIDHFNATMEENKPAKVRQLKTNVEVWERQLAEKTNDSFYESFPIGECNRELKARYEAGKIVLKKLNSTTTVQVSDTTKARIKIKC